MSDSGLAVTKGVPRLMESPTTLGSFKAGTAVNLERAMPADGRFGGHLVQGHVDGTGSVISITPEDGATVAVLRKGFAGAARQRGGVQPKLFHALPSPFAASAADGHESDDGLRPC